MSPTEVDPGKNVEISAIVPNAGGDNGAGSVILSINGVVESSQDVNIVAGQSKKVTFTVNKVAPGKYLVDVNGQVSFFTVKGTALQASEESAAAWWPLPLYIWIIVGAAVLIAIGAFGFWWWRRNSYY